MLSVIGVKYLRLLANQITSDMALEYLFDGVMNGGFDNTTQLAINLGPPRAL